MQAGSNLERELLPPLQLSGRADAKPVAEFSSRRRWTSAAYRHAGDSTWITRLATRSLVLAA